MDISKLVIGRSLTIPFAVNLDGTEKPAQREPELAAIDFGVLSKATREFSGDIETPRAD